ncbi:MAG TPA: type II methionyl aminopeptidase [Candidatus Nanoarchaeia archaeon]|nr:type II methionyl aminopeptidase [Candidatus Nanoarchaeia archaeon]
MEDLDKWRKAGKIAAEALEYGRNLIKNGAVIREVCDKIDQKIIDLGAKPAWPSQMGLDAVAAHSTPSDDDNSVFDNNLVCLDVGAHIDGCVGDNATSVDLSGKYKDILKASEEALNNAIKVVKIGATLGEIGRVIQETIEKYGLVPVRNLSGHGISPWVIHDQPSIPNFDTKDDRALQGDQIIAIEPFATNGAGMIYEAEQANLFSLVGKKPVRSVYAREILQFIEVNYNTLPFTKRWLVKQFGLGKTNLALNEMLRLGMLHPYPPLIERNKGMVAVFEKTLYVGDKVEILTKI